jgi:hypothetical protein
VERIEHGVENQLDRLPGPTSSSPGPNHKESDNPRDHTEGPEPVITKDDLRTLIGATAYDNDGDKIGKVGSIYYDDNTNEPKWITINTGFFGTNETFVPLHGASASGDRVTLAYNKAKVKDAPNIAEDGHLSPEEEQRLHLYYGIDYGSGAGTGTTGTETTETGTASTGTASTAAGLTGTVAGTGGVDRDWRARRPRGPHGRPRCLRPYH